MAALPVYRDAVGLSLDADDAATPEQAQRRRDPAFREKVLLAHHGAGLVQPQGRECLPQPGFLAWHRAEVFKEPARE
jgi:hypothetical protein